VSVVQNQVQPSPHAAYTRARISQAWGMGFFLLIVGGIMLGISTAMSADEGQPFVLLLGVIAAVAGQVLLLIAVIATGVRLGIESAKRSL